MFEAKIVVSELKVFLFLLKLNILLKIDEIPESKDGITFVYKKIPNITKSRANPNKIRLIPNPKIDVKNWLNKLIIETIITTTEINSKVAKITKIPKAKKPKINPQRNKSMEITKIKGNHIGKKIIFKNSSNIINP